MRKQWVTPALLLSALMFSGTVRAEEKVKVFVGAGLGFSNGDGLFLTYQDKRFEYQLSLWNGDSDNAAVGVGYPLRFGRKVKLGWTPGIATIERKTEVLGTHWQFHNRFELIYAPSFDFQAHVAWIHYSNCASICNHSKRPNLGENFVTLGLRYSLRPKRVMAGNGLPPPIFNHTKVEDG